MLARDGGWGVGGRGRGSGLATLFGLIGCRAGV